MLGRRHARTRRSCRKVCRVFNPEVPTWLERTMNLKISSISALLIGFSAFSFQVFPEDLSGCDREELDILRPMVDKGYWTEDELISHCRPGLPCTSSMTCNNGGRVWGMGGDGDTYRAEWSGYGVLNTIPYVCCNNTPFLHFKLNGKSWPTAAWGISESSCRFQCK